MLLSSFLNNTFCETCIGAPAMLGQEYYYFIKIQEIATQLESCTVEDSTIIAPVLHGWKKYTHHIQSTKWSQQILSDLLKIYQIKSGNMMSVISGQV
eukprot:6480102-Amphidinium_carterae.3